VWEFKDDRPIYLQIIEFVKLRIVSGEYKPGDKLLSVRELAAEAAVNPNTMQKALSELEREGLVFSQRTMGRFITEDQDMVERTKRDLAMEQVAAFFAKMEAIGFSKKEILELLEQNVEEEK
jgi:DNA-binding transcriptional regulator YhcF (GntR family)